jgi:DNA-binding MarR family transcriptional regulator
LDWGALRGIVGFHIARAAVTTYEAFERHLGKPFDLRKVDFSLLMLLLANDGLAPKRLARALSVTAPKLTQLLDQLQQRGLLERLPNPLDGRSQRVLLTDAGQQLAQQARAASAPMEAEWRSRLSPAEHAMLIELLGKLSGRGAPAVSAALRARQAAFKRLGSGRALLRR